jgi:ABC-type bacteriocin/lantibiotic exporter with double-glycine peptidase domain
MGKIKLHSKKPTQFAMFLVGVISLIAISALGEEHINAVFPIWRCPANGGVNIIYCYLRINRIPCDYSNLLRNQKEILGNGEFTALTMEQLAAKNGLPLKTVALTLKDLKTCSLPVIVHIDGESPQAGAFLLLFGISDHDVAFMYGPSASIRSMDLESFKRVWSGTALLPSKDHYKQNITLLIFGFGIGLVLIIPFHFYYRVV